MRRLDDSPIDPEIAASLDAIDATLAGEPVDPKYAELAELALLLSAERPEPRAEFGHAMDERVARRFAPAPVPSAPQPRRRSWWLVPAWGSGAVALAVALLVVVNIGGSSSQSSATFDSAAAPIRAGAPSRAAASTASTPTPAPKAPVTASSSAGAAASAPVQAASHGAATSSANGSSGSFSAASSAPAAIPTPPNGGRKTIQSAQLSLSTPANHIDDVTRELFGVIRSEGGFVNQSTVTSGSNPGGYAEFQLSVPSQNLSNTMGQLSSLQYAKVNSRTDNSQDVNNQYVGDLRKLSDDRAARTALLKQLANASTTQQVDSLNQQIHDIDGQISSDETTLNTLNHQVDYSQVQVTVNAANIVPAAHKSTGFTVGKAAHDAGRVLTVAAGVGLITLAVLVPLGLVAALGWWLRTATRRRRREQALDLA